MQQNPGGDISFNTTCGQADKFYTADNEPTDQIEQGRADMEDVQSDLYDWTMVAEDWEISVKTTAQLQAAAQKLTQALATATNDIAAVIAAS